MEDLAKSGYRNQITVQKNFSHPSIFFGYTQKTNYGNLVIFTNFFPQLLAIENPSPPNPNFQLHFFCTLLLRLV